MTLTLTASSSATSPLDLVLSSGHEDAAYFALKHSLKVVIEDWAARDGTVYARDVRLLQPPPQVQPEAAGDGSIIITGPILRFTPVIEKKNELHAIVTISTCDAKDDDETDGDCRLHVLLGPSSLRYHQFLKVGRVASVRIRPKPKLREGTLVYHSTGPLSFPSLDSPLPPPPNSLIGTVAKILSKKSLFLELDDRKKIFLYYCADVDTLRRIHTGDTLQIDNAVPTDDDGYGLDLSSTIRILQPSASASSVPLLDSADDLPQIKTKYMRSVNEMAWQLRVMKLYQSLDTDLSYDSFASLLLLPSSSSSSSLAILSLSLARLCR